MSLKVRKMSRVASEATPIWPLMLISNGKGANIVQNNISGTEFDINEIVTGWKCRAEILTTTRRPHRVPGKMRTTTVLLSVVGVASAFIAPTPLLSGRRAVAVGARAVRPGTQLSMALDPKKTVVVTGLGVMSGVGEGLEGFWENLTAGKGSIARVTRFDVTTTPTPNRCRVSSNPAQRFSFNNPEP